MHYAADWNKLDSFIFLCEQKISQLTAAIRDNKETEPDVELMIQAETEHLRDENENLKRRELPIYLLKEDGQYFCPKCRMEIMDAVKYCPNCGHRVMKKIESAD